MTIGLKIAPAVVTALTTLIVSGILVDAATIPLTAQGLSSSTGFDPTPFLQSAKMHLMEATKDIKMDNSPATTLDILIIRLLGKHTLDYLISSISTVIFDIIHNYSNQFLSAIEDTRRI